LGPEQLIDVGGKLEADAEPKRKKPRTDETVEPVFFHSMPTPFYTELLTAFNIMGVIDLCAGEGACAIAAYRQALPYVGVTFNEQHSARLLSHLETVVLSSMTTEGDPLYDVKFADAVRSESAGASGGSSSTASKVKGKLDSANPAQPLDPADPIADEPYHSGDDHDTQKL
jgi:hypothetical protein